jgi:hypothetical protein
MKRTIKRQEAAMVHLYKKVKRKHESEDDSPRDGKRAATEVTTAEEAELAVQLEQLKEISENKAAAAADEAAKWDLCHGGWIVSGSPGKRRSIPLVVLSRKKWSEKFIKNKSAPVYFKHSPEHDMLIKVSEDKALVDGVLAEGVAKAHWANYPDGKKAYRALITILDEAPATIPWTFVSFTKDAEMIYVSEFEPDHRATQDKFEDARAAYRHAKEEE